MEEQYRYFVSYFYVTYDRNHGFGNNFYTMDFEIDKAENIRVLEDHIKENLREENGIDIKGPVIILNFQLTK